MTISQYIGTKVKYLWFTVILKLCIIAVICMAFYVMGYERGEERITQRYEKELNNAWIRIYMQKEGK